MSTKPRLDLTLLQRAVIHRIAIGKTTEQIAAERGISQQGVSSVLTSAKKRTGIGSTPQLVATYALSPEARGLRGEPPPFPPRGTSGGVVGRFGTELLRFRIARKWSQKDLARRANVNHSYISRLEAGQRQPTRDTVTQFARALDLSPQEHARLLIAAFVPDGMDRIIAEVMSDQMPPLSRLADRELNGLERTA